MIEPENGFLKDSIEFNYKMLISVVKFTTLYLLNKKSETEFLVQDGMKKQYLVKIGEKIQCSCHVGNLGHCLHSLYILLRLYKLKQDDPLLFKKGYTTEEVQSFTKIGAFVKQTQSKSTKEQEIQRKLNQIKLNSPKKIQQKDENQGKLINDQQNEQIYIAPQTVCSICYDLVQNQTPIFDCRKCHNYFHTKCLRVWVGQKQKQQAQCSCPMCRYKLQKNIVQVLTKVEADYIKKYQSHGVNCSVCNKDILIKIFRCLLCEDCNLCSDCYTKWQHKNHDKFICKLGKKMDWSVSERSDFNINRLNANLEYSKQAKQKGEQYKELMGQKYQQFVNSYMKKTTLKEHILNTLLDVQKQIHKTYKKIDFGEQDIVCCMCKKKKIVGMRRMTCKHFIDDKCLKYFIEKGLYRCPIDKSFMLPGLQGVNNKQK